MFPTDGLLSPDRLARELGGVEEDDVSVVTNVMDYVQAKREAGLAEALRSLEHDRARRLFVRSKRLSPHSSPGPHAGLATCPFEHGGSGSGSGSGAVQVVAVDLSTVMGEHVRPSRTPGRFVINEAHFTPEPREQVSQVSSPQAGAAPAAPSGAAFAGAEEGSSSSDSEQPADASSSEEEVVEQEAQAPEPEHPQKMIPQKMIESTATQPRDHEQWLQDRAGPPQTGLEEDDDDGNVDEDDGDDDDPFGVNSKSPPIERVAAEARETIRRARTVLDDTPTRHSMARALLENPGSIKHPTWQQVLADEKTSSSPRRPLPKGPSPPRVEVWPTNNLDIWTVSPQSRSSSPVKQARIPPMYFSKTPSRKKTAVGEGRRAGRGGPRVVSVDLSGPRRRK